MDVIVVMVVASLAGRVGLDLEEGLCRAVGLVVVDRLLSHQEVVRVYIWDDGIGGRSRVCITRDVVHVRRDVKLAHLAEEEVQRFLL